MKKTTKGALAAGSAAVLLMGGAGTLAFWNANTDVDGVAVTAGELKIINDNCVDADWVFDSGEDEADKVYAAGDLIVPGDELTKTCTFEIQATGEHLRANLDVTEPSLSGALAPNLTLVDTYQVGGVDLVDGDITEDNDGDVVTANISVTFNGSSTNATQTLAGALSDFTLSLTQDHD
ncbi:MULTISPECIES: alternate-type signal peptide domain-containing protein [unclassified Nocardioides]|uniref:alternate-type signal peptide domain-containing protein n=1 Tax=unclassified Nocardioides TaxID=2615069 RepID=UPI0007038038|nr:MULTISPECIES: alternate-type signal peptide domain-containing protein [unclassified Nocardioides]KRC48990.1 hypothetical protein ASE19_19030 [Nocardioides sp. Root79]KRC75391.1 hypothetical protein ASE20_20935 [Nocardioides sp. Root240]